MIRFGIKFCARISQHILHHNNSAKTLSKFCPRPFLSKVNTVGEKTYLKFHFLSVLSGLFKSALQC